VCDPATLLKYSHAPAVAVKKKASLALIRAKLADVLMISVELDLAG
jgi:hypothetical protein